MRLFRYLFVATGLRILYCLVGLFCVFTIIDCVEISTRPHWSQLSGWWLILAKSPLNLSQMIPVASVLGVGWSAGYLRRTGQWLGIESLGIHPIQPLVALLTPALVLTGLAAVLILNVAPKALAYTQDLPSPAPADPTADREEATTQIRKVADAVVVSIGKNKSYWIVSGWQGDKLEVCEGDGGMGGGRQCLDSMGYRKQQLDAKALREIQDAFEVSTVRPQLDPLNSSLSRQTLTQLLHSRVSSRQFGVDDAPIAAELGLRFALVSSCWILPFVYLLFVVQLRLESAVVLAFVALLYCLLYLAAIVVLWTLVANRVAAWPWLGFGLPLLALFVGLGVGAFARSGFGIRSLLSVSLYSAVKSI